MTTPQTPGDQEWLMVQSEAQQNEEPIQSSGQILEMTNAIHELTLAYTQPRK